MSWKLADVDLGIDPASRRSPETPVAVRCRGPYGVRATIGAVAVALLAAGCSGSVGAQDDRVRRRTALLSEGIRWMLDDWRPGASRPLPITVFVEAVGDRDVELEVQTEIVNGLTDQAKIRFIDDQAEVVDGAMPRHSVRDGGLLLRFGEVVEDEGTASFYAQRYADATDSVAYKLVLTGSGERWEVQGAPAVVPVADRSPQAT